MKLHQDLYLINNKFSLLSVKFNFFKINYRIVQPNSTVLGFKLT